MDDWQHGGFGLYIHWPFCETKCPYCDFNSHVASSIDQRVWEAAYLAEIDRVGIETSGRRLDTIFFGGGTPSLMEPSTVASIIERVRTTWTMRNNPEITLEANPSSIEAGRFLAYKNAGVSRISMGMQALNDRDLKKLGRRHSAEEGRKAFEIARRCFDRVSFDLIYARQDQDVVQWQNELSLALELAVDHLSLYQLTIEEGTAFAGRLARGGLKGLPKEDLAADMFEATQEMSEKFGFPAYEISNHARFGSESQHNLIYWRGGDYVGIGPGAHGRLTISGTRWATEAPKSPALWLQMISKGRAGEQQRHALSPKDHALEYLMMSLRLQEGVDLKRYNAIAPQPLDGGRIEYLKALAMITDQAGRLIATKKGKLVLNAVLRELAED